MSEARTMTAPRRSTRPPRRLRTLGAAAGVAVLIAATGWLLASLPPLYHVPEPVPVEPVPTEAVTPTPPQSEREVELRRRFDEAVVMLHAGRHEFAITALHRVLEISPRLPEAHVNMGYALLGLERYAAARDFFRGAIDLRPQQANAYYGLAVAHEGLAELPEALGAMRSYLHLAGPEEPHRTKARSALWEWEAELNRRRAGSAAQPPTAAPSNQGGAPAAPTEPRP